MVTFAIPDGYKVRKLPENLIVKHADFDIDITFDHTGKDIVYRKKFIFKTGVIRRSELEKWNNFNKSLVNLYNQQIVLTKQ